MSDVKAPHLWNGLSPMLACIAQCEAVRYDKESGSAVWPSKQDIVALAFCHEPKRFGEEREVRILAITSLQNEANPGLQEAAPEFLSIDLGQNLECAELLP